MVTNCQILFDNNSNGTFYSGQMLTGKIVLNLTEKKKVRSVYLKIEGYAKCQWSVTKGGGNTRRTVTFTGYESYLNQTTYVLGSQSGSTLELPAGITTYGFACMLPEQLPSSFEGKHGHIRYSCKAVIDRPWKIDKEYRLSFSVIKQEDLNLLPALAIPAKSEIVRHFYCCCFKSKPFFMSSSINFSGFVPGQKIEVTIFMNNQSNVDIEGTKISLERNTQYISQQPRKKVRSECLTVKEIYGVGMRKNGSGEIKLSLLVPPLSPTNLNFSNVITTYYQLKVLAKVAGAHKNPHLNIPIRLGTIPLRASLPSPHYQVAMNSSQPSAPLYQELPPPSYEEATSIQPEMTEGDANVSIFNPRYPVWNFSANISEATTPNNTPVKMPLK